MEHLKPDKENFKEIILRKKSLLKFILWNSILIQTSSGILQKNLIESEQIFLLCERYFR